MKKIKYSFFIRIIKSILNFHKPGNAKNIFIFSLPRSGSTWLMELIWSQPEFKCCNEPLDLTIKQLKQLSKIDGFQDLYSNEAKPRLLKYFYSISSGGAHFMDPHPFRKNYRFFTSRIVFKVIHGGEKFINEIVDNSNGVVVYLLRHPIPVALSRKKLPRLDELCSPFSLQGFSEEEKKTALKIQQFGNELEKRVLAWCLQNKIALNGRNENWMVITYEQLSIYPSPIINRLVEFCGLPKPDLIYEGLNIPSAVTAQSDNQSKSMLKAGNDYKADLIGRWMDIVHPDQAKELMRICEIFGFNIYTYNSPLPSDNWLIK